MAGGVYFLVKSCREINRPVLFEQRVGGISHNRQQPGAAIGTMESTERFERSKICPPGPHRTRPLRSGAAIWPNCARRRDEAASPKSGLRMPRYRVHQLVSTVSCFRFVSRPVWGTKETWLGAKVAKWLRSTSCSPLDFK